ncbi:hypothetical protein J6590_086309 [Homalodisca vitripennis]|nr:hypothetical protein J6590_086309 [Homalodisca vitripennis]
MLISALDWQSLPERLCSRTPASTVLYRTGHSVMNYSFAVVLCVSESVKDIFRLHACRQDSSLFPHLLITTWPSTTADYEGGNVYTNVRILKAQVYRTTTVVISGSGQLRYCKAISKGKQERFVPQLFALYTLLYFRFAELAPVAVVFFHVLVQQVGKSNRLEPQVPFAHLGRIKQENPLKTTDKVLLGNLTTLVQTIKDGVAIIYYCTAVTEQMCKCPLIRSINLVDPDQPKERSDATQGKPTVGLICSSSDPGAVKASHMFRVNLLRDSLKDWLLRLTKAWPHFWQVETPPGYIPNGSV